MSRMNWDRVNREKRLWRRSDSAAVAPERSDGRPRGTVSQPKINPIVSVTRKAVRDPAAKAAERLARKQRQWRRARQTDVKRRAGQGRSNPVAAQAKRTSSSSPRNLKEAKAHLMVSADGMHGSPLRQIRDKSYVAQRPSPKVLCEERSGYPCRREVSLDSPHCGNPRHFPGANGGNPIRRERAQAIPPAVSEGHDVTDGAPDLDPVIFNVRRIRIAPPASDQWGRHPDALRAQIRDAVLHGGYWRTPTGEHLLELGRHQMLLSPDGLTCETYRRLPDLPETVSGESISTLRVQDWDGNDVTIQPYAIRLFTGRHRVTESTAVSEILALLDDAAARGKHKRSPNGNHTLYVDGFSLTLSPDGRSVLRYSTLHAERTPSQVRGKVPSRFRRSRLHDPEDAAERDRLVAHVPSEQWQTTATVAASFDPARARITGTVLDHRHPERYSILKLMRDDLRDAASAGQWTSSQGGNHILDHAGRQWTISPHGRGVLQCNPPWTMATTDERAGGTAGQT